MRQTLIYKILSQHLLDGKIAAGEEIGIGIDQTLTQDATGTTAFLLFESMGAGKVKTQVSVSYVDHNMSQFGPWNHNDHLYLQTMAAKSGIYHSRAGNGICHQVHLERFAKPGTTLLGGDSHTPTCGAVGALAIGAGGLDVAVAMTGGAFYLTCPRVLGVKLSGQLSDWVAAKDVILKLLGRLSTKQNVGWAVEYFGPGASTLSVPQRATITNMGAELGVTTSIFGSDEQTRKFLAAQKREEDYQPLAADADAEYDRIIEINLAELEPMVACPSSPDNVKTVAEIAGIETRQVVVGSCTNSSFADLMMVAGVLKGRRIDSMVEFAVAPGSREVLNMLAGNGALADMISAGARILEAGCGPCIGQGFSPADGVVSLRTFNRNFAGRSGTTSDKVYLVSPETAVASVLTGRITDPRDLPKIFGIELPRIEMPDEFTVDDSMIEKPLSEKEAAKVKVIRGPTIVVPETPLALPKKLQGAVLIKCGDKVTTDHIMPAGPFLKLRSNVPIYAKMVFNCFNEKGKPTFTQRALELKEKSIAGVIVAGESYGQGSSREHAALCPMYLGVRLVIAKSIERIHKANLINFCIVPVEFAEPADYEKIKPDDQLRIDNLLGVIEKSQEVKIINETSSFEFVGRLNLSKRDREILLSAGLVNYTGKKAQRDKGTEGQRGGVEKKDINMKLTNKILLPSKDETAAITLKPKTAALCCDRIWGTSDDIVPRSIRCWGGTQEELNGVGLAADWNIKTKRSPVLAVVGPEDKKLEMLRASSDPGLASAFRRISMGFFNAYGSPLIPIFDFVKQRNEIYQEGKREVVITTLSDLEIVDEEQLSWEQVIGFRADEENRKKYRRFLHWLDKDMIGKSQSFIEDEIAIKLDEYESALKKYGIKTILGTIEECLDGKMFLKAFMAGERLNLAGHPNLGFLVGAGIVIGKIAIKLTQVMLGYDDIERGPNSEISWVYEAKNRLN